MSFSCVDCALSGCSDGSGRYPGFCPTKAMTGEQIEDSVDAYLNDERAIKMMRAAMETSIRAFADVLCRAEEIMDFAARMGYRKIGIASCSGLREEARVFAKILRLHDFEAYGITCKVGSIEQERLKEEGGCSLGKISCNPILQAEMLNEAKVDLNVVIGLCTGHDTLFYLNAEAPCTTLVVKDRATANNPAAALNAAKGVSPYSRMLKPDPSFAPKM